MGPHRVGHDWRDLAAAAYLFEMHLLETLKFPWNILINIIIQQMNLKFPGTATIYAYYYLTVYNLWYKLFIYINYLFILYTYI